MNIDTSKQFLEFYKKKGDYLVSLSENHFKNVEYRKCLELLNEFLEIKEKYFKKKTA